MTEEDRYFSYLLRFCRDDSAAPWRVVLEDIHTGESRGFASLDGLFSYLRDRADAGTDAAARPTQPD